MQMTGMTPNGYRLWMPFEAGTLRESHPNYRRFHSIVIDRTRPAAYSKASRMGITRPRGRPWDYNEITRLRRMFPTASKAELLAAFPDRTWSAITSAAYKRHIYRAQPVLPPTGSAFLDQILARARRFNLSLADLDSTCGHTSYFRTRAWRHRAFRNDLHVKAAVSLGGKVSVKWGEKPHAL
jgi:hypothetical protein